MIGCTVPAHYHHGEETMQRAIGIRREDKYQWERRAPLTPEQVAYLVRQCGLEFYVQPSSLRVFGDEAYRAAGARVQEDLSPCSLVLGVKEMPPAVFERNKTYCFFSHTIKGQPYNMPMLRQMMAMGCQLIDYEKITDDDGRRLVLFGRHAGISGMIESLHALGKRLTAEGFDDRENLFLSLKQPYQYRDMDEAREALLELASRIREEGFPKALIPLVVGFLGYGNVSQGAQEILDCLPVIEIPPEKLMDLDPHSASNKTIYKVVFKEEHTVEQRDGISPFSLKDYYLNPQNYRPVFSRYLPCLTVVINGVYWDARYPVLIGVEDIKKLYTDCPQGLPNLRVIGDITCDIEGSIALTRKATLPDEPCYVYDIDTDTLRDGTAHLRGPVIMAVDILPTEFPVEASDHFGRALLPFLPAMAASEPGSSFHEWQLPAPIKRAVILFKGKLTEEFRYLERYLT